MTFDRRRFLKAMGLGAGSLFLPSLVETKAYASPPKRLVLFLTEHGPVTGRWEMRRPGLPETRDFELALDDPDPASFSETLRPLHAHRRELTILEGLSMASAYADPEFVGNSHFSSVFNRAAAQGGVPGGSFDQLIAEASTPVAGFPYLFYTNAADDLWLSSPIYDPSGHQVMPGRLGGFTYLRQAFERVFGGLPDPTDPMSRASPLERSRRRRESTLALVEHEYAKVARRLSGDDLDKLRRHRDMIADLERRVVAAEELHCDRPAFPTNSLSPVETADLALTSLIPAAMACDLTRVAVLGAAQLEGHDFGASDDRDVHQAIAHRSMDEPEATAMTSYYAVHARQFASLIEAFAAVPEGTGTMLDHSLLVWLPELGNGWHDLHDLMIVMAGGAGGAFETGRYLRYAEDRSAPRNVFDLTIGPPHTKLLVSILNAFGIDRRSLGVTSAVARDGSTYDLTGPLPRL